MGACADGKQRKVRGGVDRLEKLTNKAAKSLASGGDSDKKLTADKWPVDELRKARDSVRLQLAPAPRRAVNVRHAFTHPPAAPATPMPAVVSA